MFYYKIILIVRYAAKHEYVLSTTQTDSSKIHFCAIIWMSTRQTNHLLCFSDQEALLENDHWEHLSELLFQAHLRRLRNLKQEKKIFVLRKIGEQTEMQGWNLHAIIEAKGNLEGPKTYRGDDHSSLARTCSTPHSQGWPIDPLASEVEDIEEKQKDECEEYGYWENKSLVEFLLRRIV